MKQKKEGGADLVVNRKAFHDYEVLEGFEAGLVLLGTEIKSLRDHGGALQDAYVRVVGGEAFLIGASIAPYKFGNIHNHEEKRDRKLLLHRKEIEKLRVAMQEKGLTIVPLVLYLVKGRAKLKIAIAKGKKLYDKRAALKEKEAKRRVRELF